MLRVSNITKSFGYKTVLNRVSFDLPDGKISGLIGPSGGGKSVLLKVMAGTIIPDTGDVVCEFGSLQEHGSLMFQEGALFDSLSVFDNIAFPLVQGRVPSFILGKEERELVQDKVSEILSRVGLTKAAYKMPAQLSGGMKRRASLARALVSRPKYVLLDDPTSGLDPVASSVIMELIVEIQREYSPSMIIASHDLRRLLPAVDNTIALFEGEIRFQGTLDELRRIRCEEVKRFIACRFDLEGDYTTSHP